MQGFIQKMLLRSAEKHLTIIKEILFAPEAEGRGAYIKGWSSGLSGPVHLLWLDWSKCMLWMEQFSPIVI